MPSTYFLQGVGQSQTNNPAPDDNDWFYGSHEDSQKKIKL
jgi:hypothetical protein